MKHSMFGLFVAVTVILVGVSFSYAAERVHSRTGASKIDLFVEDGKTDLSEILFGEGIEGVTLLDPRGPTAGGEVRWIKTREKTDQRGYRHVFYRQMYHLGESRGSSSPSHAVNGIWLDGSEIGLHYDPNGQLWYVHGAQYEDVASVSSPVIDTAEDAYALARTRAGELPDFELAETIDIPSGFKDAHLSKSKILLRSAGDGRSFRYIWETYTRNSAGTPYVATLDAETGMLLSIHSSMPYAACGADTDDQDSAEGESQRGNTRYVWATELNNPGTYTHEAHLVSTSGNPEIEVFYGTEEEEACQQSNAQYAMFPVPTVSGTVTYPSSGDEPDEYGPIATDAIYFTYKTMQTFDDYGRDGWDDSGGIARVVVNAGCSLDNRAAFIDDFYDWAPYNSVAICTDSSETLYADSAAIDVVAHEWGHGVIFETVGWDYEDDYEEYHEGWADVIGHIVEWDHQSAGSGAEQAEWKFGEDRNDHYRRADVYSDSNGFSFHEDDPNGSTTDQWRVGNRMSVAMRLMAVGGCNPICEHITAGDGLDGCDGDGNCDWEVDGMGITKTSATLFHAIENWLSYADEWEDFPDLVKTSAFTVHNNCPSDNAADEQQTVLDAFTQIGYESEYGILWPCW